MGCRHAAVTSWRHLAAASQKARFQLKISNYGDRTISRSIPRWPA